MRLLCYPVFCSSVCYLTVGGCLVDHPFQLAIILCSSSMLVSGGGWYKLNNLCTRQKCVAGCVFDVVFAGHGFTASFQYGEDTDWIAMGTHYWCNQAESDTQLTKGGLVSACFR